jgi:hypothetical protein
VDQPDRQWGDQFTAAGLGQHPAAQPGLDEMQLSLLCRPVRYADWQEVRQVGAVSCLERSA